MMNYNSTGAYTLYAASTGAYTPPGSMDIIFAGEDWKGIKPYRGKRMVTVYKVSIIDREKETFLDEQTVMGESPADAMLSIELTDDMRKLKKQDKLAIITDSIGTFEKFEIQEVRMRNADE
jgi:hypothetical protein